MADQLDKEFESIAPITFMYRETCDSTNQTELSKKIRKFYFGDRPIDLNTKSELTDVSFNKKGLKNLEKSLNNI